MKKIGGDYETLMLIDTNGVIQADGVGGSYKGINIDGLVKSRFCHPELVEG